MAVGEILKEEGLVIEKFLVKANEDIEKGELCYDDGNGILAATKAAAGTSKVVMACEDHDYSEVSYHYISCVVKGFVIAQKVSGSGATSKLDKLTISATAGEVTKFAAGDVTATVNESTVEAANLVNLAIIGFATKASLDADVVQEMYLGGA